MKFNKLIKLGLLAGVLFTLPACSASSEPAKEPVKIGVPSDATNQARAIALLDEAGLIEVDEAAGYTPELKDINKTVYNIEIVPTSANMLVSALDDFGAAAINCTYAVPAGLDPNKEGLLTEVQEVGSDNPFINTIVVRTEDKDNPLYKKIVDAYQSQTNAQYILAKNNGAVKPAFVYDETDTVEDPEAFVKEIEGYQTTADGSTTVTIGVCGSADGWKAVQKVLDESGENILIKPIVFDAYNLPNEALANGEIDLNSFQHKAYLQSEIDSQGYDLTPIGDTSSAPLTLFSRQVSSLDELKELAGKVE